MLKVVKIIEGGINLETQEELPRSIVISNGYREVHVAVNDNVIRELVALFVDNGEPHQNIPVGDSPNAPTTPRRPIKRPSPSPPPVATTTGDTFEVEDEQVFDEDEGFEPGEEFSDSGTGASSL